LEDQENISPYPYPNDNNYAYDEQGHLTQDILAGIGPNGITWNLQDKVRRVTRDPNLPNNAATPDLEFRYGATGHRTVKVMKPRSGGVQQPARDWERTYYIHDAQGNPMATYHRTYQANGGTSYTDRFMQEDALIYGSKRLGNWHGGRLKTRGLTSATTAMTGVTYGTAPDWTNGQGGYPTTALSVTRDLGLRRYELSNHLGNVLSTVSDRRLAVASGSVLAYYRADEQSYADYDPYGMLLPGRLGGGFADQNFGFQGQLKDDELNGSAGTSYAFEYRVHDPRVGRFLSVDPLAQKYPHNSPYAFSENRVIDAIELEGLESVPFADLVPHDQSEWYDHPSIFFENIVLSGWNTVGFGLNTLEVLVTDGPGAAKQYVGGQVRQYSDAMAADMIQSYQSGEHTNGWSYMADRMSEPEAIEGMIGGGVVVERVLPSLRAPSPRTMTLYRGVNNSHVAFESAEQGIVVPNGGTATPLQHNTVLGSTLWSPYTSWTTNPAVAENFALRPTGTGVVVKAEVPVSQTVVSPNLKSVLLRQTGTVVSESEVLVKGSVSGTSTSVP
jgi:RHS repeat-associated protein